MREIIIQYNRKPIESIKYDFEAYREDWDLGEPIGYGSTEIESLKDLLEKEIERKH